MPRKPPANVVVITGASSVVGQALALEFALRGDAVVLAAASEELLETPKRACEMLGAWTHGVVVPERNERAVRELAQQAAERFGRIDVWVNHAAPYERADAEGANGAALAAELAMFEMGARTALRVFEVQKRGVLVNIEGYANISGVTDTTRNAVRTLFGTIGEQGATKENVTVHNIVSEPGTAVNDVSGRVVDLARSSARGDALGRAAALLTMQQIRMWSGARKARRKFVRDASADTLVLHGSVKRQSGAVSDEVRRRGGWHLAHATDNDRPTALLAVVALPLLMAGLMLAVVRG